MKVEVLSAVPKVPPRSMATSTYQPIASGFEASSAIPVSPVLGDIIANDFVGNAGQQFVTILASAVGFTSDVDRGVWQRI